MTILRFSAAPNGPLNDRAAPWTIFGESLNEPDGLEASAFSGPKLAEVSGTPGAPMFETYSLFGSYMAERDLGEPSEQPIIVCVHSLFFEPRRPVLARVRSDNAHRKIFHTDEGPEGAGPSAEREAGVTPWFSRLLARDPTGPVGQLDGVAIGFCYPSYGGAPEAWSPGKFSQISDRLGLPLFRKDLPPYFARAYADAEFAGFALAGVLRQIIAKLDHDGQDSRKIDLLCHGLGARVVLSALALLAQRAPACLSLSRIDRVVMIGAIAYAGQAAATLANILFAETIDKPQFYNIRSEEDALLRWLARRRMPTAAAREACDDLSLSTHNKFMNDIESLLGRAEQPNPELYSFFGPAYSGWIDLDLADRALLQQVFKGAVLKKRSYRQGRMGRHDLYFTEPMNWQLYRRILRHRKGWSVKALKKKLGREVVPVRTTKQNLVAMPV